MGIIRQVSRRISKKWYFWKQKNIKINKIFWQLFN
jgi:hypothetical protein